MLKITFYFPIIQQHLVDILSNLQNEKFSDNLTFVFKKSQTIKIKYKFNFKNINGEDFWFIDKELSPDELIQCVVKRLAALGTSI